MNQLVLKEKIVFEDIKKLHNEINQCINQIFLICTTAIAFTGVILGFIIKITEKKPVPASLLATVAKDIRAAVSDPDVAAKASKAVEDAITRTVDAVSSDFSISIILVISLFSMLLAFQFAAHSINKALHLNASYLRKTKTSIWEIDYDYFERKKLDWSHGQTGLIKIVFGILIAISLVVPLMIFSLLDLRIHGYQYWLIIFLVVTFTGCALFLLFSLNSPVRLREEADKIWQNLNSSSVEDSIHRDDA